MQYSGSILFWKCKLSRIVRRKRAKQLTARRKKKQQHFFQIVNDYLYEVFHIRLYLQSGSTIKLLPECPETNRIFEF